MKQSFANKYKYPRILKHRICTSLLRDVLIDNVVTREQDHYLILTLGVKFRQHLLNVSTQWLKPVLARVHVGYIKVISQAVFLLFLPQISSKYFTIMENAKLKDHVCYSDFKSHETIIQISDDLYAMNATLYLLQCNITNGPIYFREIMYF